MMNMKRGLTTVSAAVGALVATLACLPQAHAADPACDTLPAPIIYGIGGSAQTPLIGRIAAALAGAADPITVVYSDPGACLAMAALKSGGDLVKGSAKYWGSDGKQKTCLLPAAGVTADFGSMQNTAALCDNVSNALPAGLGTFTGPIGTVNYVVPLQSSQTSISKEAAYFVFGLGDQGQADPWVDPNFIFKRSATSAVGLFVAASLGFPAAKLKGIDASSNSGTVTKLATAGANAEKAIGFISGENADANRNAIRTLAYQHEDQTCGYWPDSSVNAYDKRNVRSGQYYFWGPAFFYAPVDNAGVITNATVKKFIGYIDGAIAAPADVPILDVTIDNGNVPLCAMNVKRTTDLGPIASYQPDEPCGCYFEARATGTTNCDECNGDGDCDDPKAPKCRHGYCEVK